MKDAWIGMYLEELVRSQLAPDNAAPVMLRRIDAKLDRISDDMRDLKVRATATEEAIAGVNRRLDRLEMRVERIEKRLDLVEA